MAGSVREALVEAMAEHQEANPIQETAPIKSAPVEKSEALPTETAEAKAERLRDEQGRFAKTEAKQEAAAAPASPAAPVTAPKEAVAEAPSLVPKYPRIRKEMWPVFDKINASQALTPEEAKQLMAFNDERERQFSHGVSTYKQEAERAKPLIEAIAPFQQDLDKHGIPAPQMVHALMSAHRTLSLGSPQEKLQNIVKVIQGYGIPIEALFDQEAQNRYLATAPAAQPRQEPPVNYDQLIEQKLQEREAKQQISRIQSNAEQYPFFPYVRETMAQLLETGEATDIESAYSMALGAPEHAMLTSALQQQQQRLAEQQAAAAKQAAAKAARANVTSPKSASPMAAASNGNLSRRDAIKEAFSTLGSNARV